jgi:tetratricopeptide (TPR) repeat protein
MEPIRADEEKAGGFIHKPMYERLLLCEYAVADLSIGNANVFYELGIRHAVKPHTTISIFESAARLPFDLAPLRTLPYSFKDDVVDNLDEMIAVLTDRLRQARQNAFTDSPIEQLVEGYKYPDLDPLIPLTEAFRDRMTRNEGLKKQMRAIVKDWEPLNRQFCQATAEQQPAIAAQMDAVIARLVQIQDSLNIGDEDYDVIVSMQVAFRAMSAFGRMVALHEHEAYPADIKEAVIAQQQYAFALNRVGRRDDSQAVLEGLIEKYGADAETLGLLGRIYKERWQEAVRDGKNLAAKAQLNKAIETYKAGYDNDPRNYYPGINALTLMYVRDNQDKAVQSLLPVIKFTAQRSADLLPQDYWAKATLLELAVLENDPDGAVAAVEDMITLHPESWMKQSTLQNIDLIYNHTPDNQTKLGWIEEIKNSLV